MTTSNQTRRPQLLSCLLLAMLAAAGSLCYPGYAQEADEVTAQVLSPTEYQIVQRDAANQGSIAVVVHIDGEPTTVEARLELMPGAYEGTPTDWTALTATDEAGEYTGEVTAVAGGWYELQVRIPAAPDNPTVATVPRVGVGEVFVIAGQSNAANHGEVPLRPEDDRVAAYGDGAWRLGYDPMPGATGLGGSPWPHLGDLLVRQLQMPVGFASVAVGGSESAFWLPGSEGYDLLVSVLKELGVNGARAVLWHQGESDNIAGTTAEEYYQNLRTTIERLPADAGWCPPWMVAGVSMVPWSPQESPNPLLGQQMLWRKGVALEGPYTDNMLGHVFRHDLLHFNEYGLRAHAERWFAMLWAQFYADVPLVMPEQ